MSKRTHVRPEPLPGGVYVTEPISHIEEHLRWMRKCGRVDATLKARRATLTRIAEAIGHDPATATLAELEVWQDGLVSLASVRHQTLLARPYYRWLHARGLRSDDPAALLPVPPRPDRLPRPIAEDDLMLAIREAPPRVAPWLLLAGWSGMRASDIAAMHRDRLLLVDGQRYARVVGKGGVERDVPIPGWVWDRIAPHLPAAGWCWVRERGPGAGVQPRTAQHVSQYTNAYLAGLGLSARLHSLRHRVGQRTLEDSGSARLVQTVLGHRDLSQVQVYTRVTPREAAAALDRLPRPADAPARTAPPPSATGAVSGLLQLSAAELDTHTERWLGTYRSAATVDAYRRDTRWWRDWLAAHGVHPLDARRSDAERWRTHQETTLTAHHRLPAPSTVARRLAAVSSWYRYLVDEGLAALNPMAGVTPPPQRRESTTLALTLDEAIRLVETAEQAGPLAAVVVWVLLATGMRVSELCALDLDDARQREDGTWLLDVIVKGGRPTEIAVPDAAGHALTRWITARPRTGSQALLVRQGLRVHRRTLHRILDPLTRAAGVTPITPHGLRHTSATLLLDEGVSLWDVQAHLRHRNLESTLRYDRARRARAGRAALTLVHSIRGRQQPAVPDPSRDPVHDPRWRDTPRPA